jgi:hypothetical protein
MRALPTLLFVLGLTLLSACTLINSPEKQRKTALEDFMYAMRWQRYQEASLLFVREHRRAFLDQIEELKELNVTDVRLKRVDQSAEGRRAEVRLEIDYYILPSATLKTLMVDQVWVYFETADADNQGYLITTPFPKFPQIQGRN